MLRPTMLSFNDDINQAEKNKRRKKCKERQKEEGKNSFGGPP